MKIAIIGLGVQGKKRFNLLSKNSVKVLVDKFKGTHYKNINLVPLSSYDTAFICTPDSEKLKIIKFCIKNKKNILVEKPFQIKNQKQNKFLSKLIKKYRLIFYTAYNHRFEPGIVKLKELINKKIIGKIYKCNIFYGNGTSLLVKKSRWRDKKPGVISDLGSHLFDICIFLFGKKLDKIKLVEANKFENKAYDHAIINLNSKKIKINLEMTFCSWENSFRLDLIGSKGSIHMHSLCKWSDSYLILKRRRFPSGKPFIKKITFKHGDPTWKREHKYFFNLIKKKVGFSTLKKDLLINKYLTKCQK